MSDPIPLADARDNLGDLVNRASYGGERVVISKRGKPVAALVSVEALRALEAYEDEEDERAVAEARANDDGVRIPLEEIEEKLRQREAEAETLTEKVTSG